MMSVATPATTTMTGQYYLMLPSITSSIEPFWCVDFVYKLFSRRAQRLAYEQQRARAEADHRKYLQMSGKIGGPPGPQGGKMTGPQASKPTYKLSMGSRKNVKKSDSGMTL